MNQETENTGIALQLENMQHKLDKVLDMGPLLEELKNGTDEIQQEITSEITKFALSIRSSKLDKTELKDWFANCYFLYKEGADKNKENSWHLAIPSFIDASFGYLERKIPGWHVFQVNPYAHWLGDIPEGLKQKMNMKDPLDVYLDGDKLVGKDIEKVKLKLAAFITKHNKDHYIIDKSQHFELLASLIKEGILPFLPKPIDKESFRENNVFDDKWELRDYHLEAWNSFKQYSNIGYYLPPSGGKTYLGIYAIGKLKGKHLVCVPSREIREQWIARLEVNTNLKVVDKIDNTNKDDFDVLVCTYQYAIRHAHKFKWDLVIVDEHHHLPANLFSKMATIERKFMIGLTATPQREDDREEYIFALTGKPCGLSWTKVKELGIIQNPDLNVWIVKDEKQRMNQLSILMNSPGQSIIFSDSIKMGAAAAKQFNLKHVHGSGKIRVANIPAGESFVCSRVGDEGISMPLIKRVIEIDWLHGSRRQELQRFTRILHGKNKDGVGHIIMTLQQFHTDRKRLFGVMEKGFKIILHREGFSDKEILHDPKKVNNSTSTGPKIITTVKITHDKSSIIYEAQKINILLRNCTTKEKKVLEICFAKAHHKYTRTNLHQVIGGRYKDFVSFPKLVSLNLLKELKKDIFQANTELLK